MKDEMIGEWQTEVNQWGGVRRYRMVGKIKEYEMMVHTEGGEIPESQLEEYNRRNREAREKQIANDKGITMPVKICPFKSDLYRRCDGSKCAFYASGCALAHLRTGTPRQTKDLRCPISGSNCGNNCALYANGCALTKESEDER